MKNLISIIILLQLCFVPIVYGQDQYLDSLTNAYQQAGTDEDKTHLAIKISRDLVHKDEEKSKIYAQKALTHAQESGDQLLVAEAKEAVADYYGSRSNFLEAANVYLQSLVIYESLNKHKKAAAISNNVANAYLGIDDLDKAEQYYIRSYNTGIKAKDTNAIAVPLVGLSIIYEKRGNELKALETTEEAIVLFEGIQRLDAMLICYLNAAAYAYNLDQKDKAWKYSARGKEINQKLDNQFYSGSILLAECDWYAKEGDFTNAIRSGEEGIQDLIEFAGAFHETKHGFKQLSEIYEMAGNTTKAYEYLKKYTHLSDSLDEVNRAEIMAEMDGKFNKIEDEKKIAELSHQSKLHQVQNEKNKLIMYLTVGAAIIMLFFLGFVINANRQKNKINQVLQLQKSIIEEKNNEILDSIQYAKRIQNAIIPSDSMISKNLNNSFVFYKPKDIVAGDFYWMEEIDDTILLAVADCTGHGVPGAMVSVVCNNALNRAVREFNLTEPAAILNKTREIVIDTFSKSQENVKDGMDITLCSWNKVTNELQYAGANNPLYLISPNIPEIQEVPADKQPIGLYDKAFGFTNHVLNLVKGDTIYLFSDGFVDQFGGKEGKKYKYAKFREFLMNSLSDSMSDQGKKLESEFIKWKGDLEQLDDICVIGIRV
ncbi:MAG: SpoIIE family protein phosphatase [Crocinitomicaceae bacterium]|nr:SpoIIE family protein phosphatase [Crocinitomicaceae bacterium]